MPPPLLRLREFAVVRGGELVFQPLNLEVEAGRTTIVSGGNGSGKTSLFTALLNCDPGSYRGRVRFDGVDLTRGGREERAKFWEQSSLVSEDAPTELVERQLLGERQAKDARQLSMGTRLRIAVDLALARRPRLLILDDAAGALDELARQELLHLLKEQQTREKLGILVLCRDSDLWSDLAPKQIVDLSGARTPRLEVERLSKWDCSPKQLVRQPKPLVSCQSVSVAFGTYSRGWGRRPATAQVLHAVSFELGWGQTLAVVGASPSGKSTLALALAGLLEPSLGRVLVRDRRSGQARRNHGSGRSGAVQVCFDDPRAALDPRMTAVESLTEALQLASSGGADVSEDADQLLETFALNHVAGHRPFELSCGQAGLLVLARALSQRPAVLILDNALAGLGKTQRDAMMHVLRERSRAAHTSQILFTNDLNLAYEASDLLAVLYAGTMVEWGPTHSVFEQAAHPYTRALLSQRPHGKARLQVLLEGAPPDPTALPSGCTFHPRCARFEPGRCEKHEPELRPLGSDAGHRVACFRPHQ